MLYVQYNGKKNTRSSFLVELQSFYFMQNRKKGQRVNTNYVITHDDIEKCQNNVII